MAPSGKTDGAETPKTNWGKIYAQLMYHFKMSYDSIKKRTIPQIEALNAELPEQLQIHQLSIPGILGGMLDGQATSMSEVGLVDKPPKLAQFAAFADAFNGI